MKRQGHDRAVLIWYPVLDVSCPGVGRLPDTARKLWLLMRSKESGKHFWVVNPWSLPTTVMLASMLACLPRLQEGQSLLAIEV